MSSLEIKPKEKSLIFLLRILMMISFIVILVMTICDFHSFLDPKNNILGFVKFLSMLFVLLLLLFASVNNTAIKLLLVLDVKEEEKFSLRIKVYLTILMIGMIITSTYITIFS